MGRVAPSLVALALLLAACGREAEPALPAACRSGPEAVERALRGAPAPVRVDGTPLSACLSRTGDPADIQQVGGDYLEVAIVLAATARVEPESPEALRLGYLIGAVRRGSAASPGFHAEMVRRLEMELVPIDTRSRAFRRGERAGRESG